MGLHCTAGFTQFAEDLRGRIPSIIDSFHVSEKSPNKVASSELAFFKRRYTAGLESAADAMERKGSLFWLFANVQDGIEKGEIPSSNHSSDGFEED